MYILFELTGTDMVFSTKDEAGVDINVDTFPLEEYTIDPADKMVNSCCELIVRKLGEPLGAWPPSGASYPRCRIIFKNSASLPFQTENEEPEALP